MNIPVQGYQSRHDISHSAQKVVSHLEVKFKDWYFSYAVQKILDWLGNVCVGVFVFLPFVTG